MKIYFLSSLPCALSANGAYFGITDLFDRHAEICLQDNLFISFQAENARPVQFFLNEDIYTRAPEGVQVYIAEHFIALFVCDFIPLSSPFVLHAQEKFENTLVSVFSQGETQCVIQSERAFVCPLPRAFCSCEISRYRDFFLLKAPEKLAVLHKQGKCVFLEKTIEFSTDENSEKPVLNATLPLSSALGGVVKCTFELQEKQAKQVACKMVAPECKKEKLIAFAFLECLRNHADPTPFLSEKILPDLEKIQEFLQGFVCITATQNENEFYLAYPKGERRFTLRKVAILLENGAIIDVIA